MATRPTPARGCGEDHGESAAARTNRALLERFEILATGDAREAHDVIAATFSPHALQVHEGILATRMHYAALPSVGIAMLNYGARVTIETQLSTWFAAIFPLEGTVSARSPRDHAVADTARALVLSPTDQLSIDFAVDTTALIVKMDRIAMERAAVRMMSAPLVEPLVFDMAMARDEPAAQSVWRLAELMIRELSTPGSAVQHEAVSAQLEQTLLQALLHAQKYRTTTGGGGTLIAPRHVKLTENYIASHADEAITIADLCRVAGVSRRTLYAAFSKFRGTSPMAYLKNIRLERVREDLLRGGGEASVTDVAMRWQFFQLGRFAGDYQRRFGEKPSETQKFARRSIA